jgi:hypothetical protein
MRTHTVAGANARGIALPGLRAPLVRPKHRAFAPFGTLAKTPDGRRRSRSGRRDFATADGTIYRKAVGQSALFLVMSPRWGSTPRLTDRLTVGRNVTLTLSRLFSSQGGAFGWRRQLRKWVLRVQFSSVQCSAEQTRSKRVSVQLVSQFWVLGAVQTSEIEFSVQGSPEQTSGVKCSAAQVVRGDRSIVTSGLAVK